MPRVTLATDPTAARRTVADLLRQLGDIPPERIRLVPTPGTATEQDVLDIQAHQGWLCELIDGVLVEKVMGFHESRLAIELILFLGAFVRQHNLGVVVGADGVVKLTTGLIRIPDVSFISWDRLPGRVLPPDPIPQVPLDLAVEILSPGNTKKEMDRKLREYFAAGTRLVWFLEPKRRTARVFTRPDRGVLLREDQALDGGAVLPGFVLPLRDLFDQASRGPHA
ncbi:MAG: Uma2 family endonuclease [Isosphaeraceae bacterium]|nr:Uma2 family endonuclease [Isosphaeraceae bacterium]